MTGEGWARAPVPRQAAIDGLLQRALRRGASALDEAEAKDVLKALGIQVPRGVRHDDACQPQEREQLKPPFAVKAMSERALHKSDIGAVLLNVTDGRQLTDAMQQIAGRMNRAGIPLSGFLVEEMCAAGTELVIGGTIDGQLGPMIMIGAGGIYAEILKDVSFRLCPIDRSDAREMIEELKVAPILKGARGRDAVDMDAIVDALLALAGRDGFFTRHAGTVAEFDINPLIARPDALVAVDCRIVLEEGAS